MQTIVDATFSLAPHSNDRSNSIYRFGSRSRLDGVPAGQQQWPFGNRQVSDERRHRGRAKSVDDRSPALCDSAKHVGCFPQRRDRNYPRRVEVRIERSLLLLREDCDLDDSSGAGRDLVR